MGIRVTACVIPWDVASDGSTVIIRPDPDVHVVWARVWEGIAQCLLTRSGRNWNADEALGLAERIRVSMRPTA